MTPSEALFIEGFFVGVVYEPITAGRYAFLHLIPGVWFTFSAGMTRKLCLSFIEAPIELPGLTVNYAEDVPYGDAERNLFDVYLPDCDGPTPLVIYTLKPQRLGAPTFPR